MGNCQAAEAATVVIHHPGINKIERIYKSVSAAEIMTTNPGHYVALVVTTTTTSTSQPSPNSKSKNNSNGGGGGGGGGDGGKVTPLKQLKLLRPNDTLHIGQVYRLVSFEEVLREFAAKKCVKLGRLLKDKGGEKRKRHGDSSSSSSNKPSLKPDNSTADKVEPEVNGLEAGGSSNISSSSSSRGVGRQHYWRPALESIAEVGT